MRLRPKTFITFVILAITYAAVNLLVAPPRTTLQHYHITSAQVHLLNVTVVVPVVAVWFVGLFGYEKLRRYANYVKDTKEGRPVQQLTKGVMVLAYWLPISSTVSTVLNWQAVIHPGWHGAIVVIVNYFSLIFTLVGFWYISQACHKLGILSKRPTSLTPVHLIALGLIAAGVTYGYLVANARGNLATIYHLPLALVLLTLTIPHIFSWYLGLMAVNNLHRYSKDVSGIIYRKGWNTLALGIAWIVVLSILLQYTTAVSAKLGDLPLGWILAIIYIILPIMAVGYIFVALGAKRLTKIEEA